MKQYHTVISIAGSDSIAGAGIQADLKTFSALGCYGATVITALTAQNTRGIQGILPIPVKFVRKELQSVLDDIKPKAIKTGMLFSSDIILMIAKCLARYKIPLIIDPVMLAKNGDALLKKSAVMNFSKKLFPLATLLTPNISEAEYLLKMPITTKLAMQLAAKKLSTMGTKAVLIKGGHFRVGSGKSEDCLYIKEEDRFYWFKANRIKTNNTHGTGCTLSSAITAFIAQGNSIVNAVRRGKRYTTKAIAAGSQYKIGKGHGPVHHFWQSW